MRQIAMDPPLYQPTQSLSQVLPESEIIKRIASIKAIDIDVLSLKIGTIVATRIGPLSKKLVKQAKSEASCFLNTNSEFLSKTQSTGFCLAFVHKMSEELASAFALGDSFLVNGYLSSDVWQKALLKNGLNPDDLPEEYLIHFRLSSSKGNLVFSLEEYSGNKLFSISTFTITDCWQH